MYGHYGMVKFDHRSPHGSTGPVGTAQELQVMDAVRKQKAEPPPRAATRVVKRSDTAGSLGSVQDYIFSNFELERILF